MRRLSGLALALPFFAATWPLPTTGQVSRAVVNGRMTIFSAKPLWTAGTAWRIDAKPALQIGMIDGPRQYLFKDPSALRLDDGRIIVGDMGTAELRYFDANGKYIRTVGRRGKGPGEFTSLTSVRRWRGDSILVTEYERSSIFTTEGRFVRNAPNTGVPGEQPVNAHGWFSDGSWLAGTWPQGSRSRTDTRVDSAHFYRIDPSGKVVKRLGSFAAVEYSGPTHVTEFAPMLSVAVRGDEFYFNYPTTYEVKVYSQDGELKRVISRAWKPVPVSQVDIKRFADAFVNQTGASGRLDRVASRERLQQMVNSTHFAKTQPAHRYMLFDALGNLWVQDGKPYIGSVGEGFSKVEDVPRTWDVFDPTGTWLGSVSTPARFRVNNIGADYITGIHIGEEDVPYVRVYHIRKGK